MTYVRAIVTNIMCARAIVTHINCARAIVTHVMRARAIAAHIMCTRAIVTMSKKIVTCNTGGSNPIFPQETPKFGFGDGQKWEKWGKKYMEREGNKLSILKIEKIPIFSHDAPKFGFGDGKKVYGKRGKKSSF